jgi:hypothetical protein
MYITRALIGRNLCLDQAIQTTDPNTEDYRHRIDIGQKLHSWVKSVPECQPTSGVAAMLKATKPEEIL